MPKEVAYRMAKQVREPADGLFGLEGRARLGPHDSKSAAILISFWDDSITKPLFLSARYGLPAHVESALSSIEPVKARFRVDSHRGLTVTGCQLHAKKGAGWQAWEAV
jgi:hypothetical protein